MPSVLFVPTKHSCHIAPNESSLSLQVTNGPRRGRWKTNVPANHVDRKAARINQQHRIIPCVPIEVPVAAGAGTVTAHRVQPFAEPTSVRDHVHAIGTERIAGNEAVESWLIHRSSS